MFVWYLSYGSNMNSERFSKYIAGGHFNQKVTEGGCRNKALPLIDRFVMFNHPLYFAGNYAKWDHQGVAFIHNRKNPKTQSFGRMYLIELSQFEDVLKQENGMAINEALDIDYDSLAQLGNYDLEDQAYGRILFLGHEDHYPIYTFTAPYDREDINEPSKDYLSTIINGLMLSDNPHISRETIYETFNGYSGIDSKKLLSVIEYLEKKRNEPAA